MSLQFSREKIFLFGYHKLDIAAVCLGDQLGLVALAADALRLAVLNGALQIRLGPRRVPETEEPWPDDDNDHDDYH